jgi:hypothetical protein
MIGEARNDEVWSHQESADSALLDFAISTPTPAPHIRYRRNGVTHDTTRSVHKAQTNDVPSKGPAELVVGQPSATKFRLPTYHYISINS